MKPHTDEPRHSPVKWIILACACLALLVYIAPQTTQQSSPAAKKVMVQDVYEGKVDHTKCVQRLRDQVEKMTDEDDPSTMDWVREFDNPGHTVLSIINARGDEQIFERAKDLTDKAKTKLKGLVTAFVEEAPHKHLRAGSKSVFLFKDNSVAVADSSTCRLDALYVGANGRYHPAVDELVHDNIDVAEDSKKSKRCKRDGRRYDLCEGNLNGYGRCVVDVDSCSSSKCRRKRCKNNFNLRKKSSKKCGSEPKCADVFCKDSRGNQQWTCKRFEVLCYVPFYKHKARISRRSKFYSCGSQGASWVKPSKDRNKCPKTECKKIGKCPQGLSPQKCRWESSISKPMFGTGVTVSKVLAFGKDAVGLIGAFPWPPKIKTAFGVVSSLFGFGISLTKSDVRKMLNQLQRYFDEEMNKLRSCVDQRFITQHAINAKEIVLFVQRQLPFIDKIDAQNPYARVLQFWEEVERKCFGIGDKVDQFTLQYGYKFNDRTWGAHTTFLTEAPNSMAMCTGMYAAYLFDIARFNVAQNCQSGSPSSVCLSIEYIRYRLQLFAYRMYLYTTRMVEQLMRFYRRKDICYYYPRLNNKIGDLNDKILRPVLLLHSSTMAFQTDEVIIETYTGRTVRSGVTVRWDWGPAQSAEDCRDFCVSTSACLTVAFVQSSKACRGYDWEGSRQNGANGDVVFVMARGIGGSVETEGLTCSSCRNVYRTWTNVEYGTCVKNCAVNSRPGCVATMWTASSSHVGTCVGYKRGYLGSLRPADPQARKTIHTTYAYSMAVTHKRGITISQRPARSESNVMMSAQCIARCVEDDDCIATTYSSSARKCNYYYLDDNNPREYSARCDLDYTMAVFYRKVGCSATTTNIDRIGLNFGGMPVGVSNMNDCKKKCEDTAFCKCWVVDGSNKKCWLKKRCGARRGRGGFKSGSCVHVLPSIRFPAPNRMQLCGGERVGTRVCIPAGKFNGGYASFKMPRAGKLQGIRFTYESGEIKLCGRKSDAGCRGRFGTPRHKFVLYVTRADKTILYPKRGTRFASFYTNNWNGKFYKMRGYNVNGKEFVLEGPGTYDVVQGEELRIYTGEVLVNQWEGDNFGTMCAIVNVDYAPEKSCTQDVGIDRPGLDISGSQQVRSAWECQQKCLANSACKCYAAEVKPNRNKMLRCWLKNACPVPTKKPSIQSGRCGSADGGCNENRNLARNKPTGQSSTGWNGPSGRAVDGNKNHVYSRHPCTHTQLENNPWWYVDLQSSKSVCSLKIWNRYPNWSSRLTNFVVFVTNRKPGRGFRAQPNEICSRYDGGDFATQRLDCKHSMPGRYVGVQLQVKGYLTLCEVEVYG